MTDEKDDDIAPRTGPALVFSGHFVNTYKVCPKCGGTHFIVKNYDEMWRDGEVWCADCDVYVRGYDAG